MSGGAEEEGVREGTGSILRWAQNGMRGGGRADSRFAPTGGCQVGALRCEVGMTCGGRRE